jgi:hypothetical protein
VSTAVAEEPIFGAAHRRYTKKVSKNRTWEGSNPVVSLLIGLARFWLAIRNAWRDPTFRLLATLTASLLLVGTVVFNRVEGWSYLDSFYFSAITVATVGYGDFSPQTDAG